MVGEKEMRVGNNCMVQCSITHILNHLKAYKREILLGNIIAIIGTLLVVVIPLFIPLLVDELLLKKSHGFIEWIETYLFTSDTKGYVAFVLVVVLALRLVSTLFEIWQTKIFTYISKEVSYAMRMALLKHLQVVSLSAYESMQVGGVTSKLVTDVETIDNFISDTISKLILAIFLLLFSAVVLLWIHWQLALFILFTNPIVILFTAKLSRNIGKLKKEENKAVELFQSTLTETLELFTQIRAANKEAYFFGKSEEKAKSFKAHAIRYAYQSKSAASISYLVFLTGYEIFRAVSILAVAYSSLSIGLMLAIFSYLWVMAAPTQSIINFQYALASAKAACKRVNEVFALSQEPICTHEATHYFETKETLSLKVENLSFYYHKEKPILQNISMSIEEGAKVALVGASGSGKTTLAHLLVGFYPIEDGEVFYGGTSHKALSLTTIRENIHLILQHPKLFNDTMLFNLTLGKEVSVSRLKEALEMAQLTELVERLEFGLETLVGKDGIKLSGGQRQRVAIARMVLANPKVVIFDESTSALDVDTETKLFDALQKFLATKTVITIAHRLSTIKSATYIYVLESGKVIDSGTPTALLAKEKGYFNAMV
jgi:ATP-binding cassette subfamily C protein